MKLEVYIPVSVIVDTDTGACELGEVGSEAWPHRADPEIWDIEAGEWRYHWSRAEGEGLVDEPTLFRAAREQAFAFLDHRLLSGC